MSSMLQKLGLEFNPFEPAGSGAPIGSDLVFADGLASRMHRLLDQHQTGHGVKAIVVVGEYGTGKTCLLQWLHRVLFPERRIRSFYFDNPGVQFYDIANALLRSIGRKDFAKFIWELAGPHISGSYQGSLFQRGFEEYLSSPSRTKHQQEVVVSLQEAIVTVGVTTDDEIAHCLARIVTDATRKPYFEYRDFIPRRSGSVVAEGEEAPYFGALVNTIIRGSGAKGVALVIDEFEEVGLQKRLTKRAAHDYLATLKRLINLSRNRESEFWIVLSLTPDAYKTTRELEPALAERLSGQDHEVRIQPLTPEDALNFVRSRLKTARSNGNGHVGSLFPFPDDLRFRPTTFNNPRRLVKACFYAISRADAETLLPFTDDYLHEVESTLYPLDDGEKRSRS